MYRIGLGYDVHPLKEGTKGLYIGGVKVSDSVYLSGHSDGDVLCHSIVDAILGASSMGNIGTWFPENDRNLGRRSLEFLEVLGEEIKGIWEIMNIDSVIVIESVRLSGFVEEIEKSIAGALGIGASVVSVKPKSGNGSVGSFAQAQAVCLLRKVG